MCSLFAACDDSRSRLKDSGFLFRVPRFMIGGLDTSVFGWYDFLTRQKRRSFELYILTYDCRTEFEFSLQLRLLQYKKHALVTRKTSGAINDQRRQTTSRIVLHHSSPIIYSSPLSPTPVKTYCCLKGKNISLIDLFVHTVVVVVVHPSMIRISESKLISWHGNVNICVVRVLAVFRYRSSSIKHVKTRLKELDLQFSALFRAEHPSN
jgi:hypothetical protein